MAPKRFSNRPLYLQLRDSLAQRIAAGDWKPGHAIPNEGDLAREFGVSTGTIRKALDQLESERLITRRQGRGTFVNDQSAAELSGRFDSIRAADGERLSEQVETVAMTESAANETECQRLQLDAQARVYRIRRLRLSHSQPFMVEDASLPTELFPGLASSETSLHSIVVLAQSYGILLGKAEERVSIGTPAPTVPEFLRVSPSSLTMILDRVVLSLDGRPVEWRVGYCRSDEKYYLAEIN